MISVQAEAPDNLLRTMLCPTNRTQSLGTSTIFNPRHSSISKVLTRVKGALRAQKRQSMAFWQETKLQYRQTAQVAFQDVSNALVSRQKFEAIRDEQAQAVQAYQESVKVSFQRYVAGKGSYFEVLDAQLQLYPAEGKCARGYGA